MMKAETGRQLWRSLHECLGLSLRYQKRFFAIWLNTVDATIGCKTCFKKLERFMKKWPPDYGEGFHLWGLCLHDFVNKELGKPLFYPQQTLAPLMQKGIIQ